MERAITDRATVWRGKPAKVGGRASVPANGERRRRGIFAGELFRRRRREECLRVPPGRWGKSPGAEGAGLPQDSFSGAPMLGAWGGAGLARKVKPLEWGKARLPTFFPHRRDPHPDAESEGLGGAHDRFSLWVTDTLPRLKVQPVV